MPCCRRAVLLAARSSRSRRRCAAGAGAGSRFSRRPGAPAAACPLPTRWARTRCAPTAPASKRAWDRARAVLRYDKNSRPLILGLKHADHTHVAGAFGRWMQRAGGEVLGAAELLVPVPLHWTRLFRRRYNQAALLANAIHRAGGPPVAADCLVRRRRTPSQGHLGPLARARNVAGRLCRAAPRRCRRQAARHHRRRDDDGGYGRRMRARAEARRGGVGWRADAGAGLAGRGIIGGARFGSKGGGDG